MTWQWWAAMVCVLGAFVVAGQIVAAQTREQEQGIEQNRDTLVTICAAMDTLVLVFEQLEIRDHALGRNRTLSPSVRVALHDRAFLYRTAVASFSELEKECAEIE